jgi:hypothetical protein
MDFTDLAKLVSKSAPLLGNVLAGPAGIMVSSLIAAKFNADPENPSQLISQISGDPQAAMKLLQIQTSNEVELQRMVIAMAKTQLKYNAPDRETATKNKERESAKQRKANIGAQGRIDKTSAILAYLLTGGTFSALGGLFLFSFPENNKEIIISIVSALTTVWVAAMAYYHGSSACSRHKDTLLAAKSAYEKNAQTSLVPSDVRVIAEPHREIQGAVAPLALGSGHAMTKSPT